MPPEMSAYPCVTRRCLEAAVGFERLKSFRVVNKRAAESLPDQRRSTLDNAERQAGGQYDEEQPEPPRSEGIAEFEEFNKRAADAYGRDEFCNKKRKQRKQRRCNEKINGELHRAGQTPCPV